MYKKQTDTSQIKSFSLPHLIFQPWSVAMVIPRWSWYKSIVRDQRRTSVERCAGSVPILQKCVQKLSADLFRDTFFA
ncbi:unnamed protein product [Tenebrio molitor]|nr:unnamed protein product [Tenebrio molitor]